MFLDLNFDERRNYELNKLEEQANQFEKNDYSEIFNKIVNDSNNKKYILDLHKKRRRKRFVNKILRKK